MKHALLALLLSGCGASGLTIANGTALGLSTSAIACDWGQTRSVASNGWAGQYEDNPIMGETPSTGTVDLYFATMLASNALLWRVLRGRWKIVVPMVVAIWQGANAVNNAIVSDRVDLRTCGM